MINCVFPVHVGDLMPIYAFRVIPLTKKASVQFLPADMNCKGGTLDNSLFILDLGQITVQFHPPMAAFAFYLVQQVSLIGCHGTTLVLICVHWNKS